jgi:transcription antitermination factor NusA-like protein
MQTVQDTNIQRQIDEALKRAKCKKVLYFYDESGYRKLLGVFDKKKASQIRKYYRSRNLINRLTEYEVVTTEPDSIFSG